jgi:hypothetical protein
MSLMHFLGPKMVVLRNISLLSGPIDPHRSPVPHHSPRGPEGTNRIYTRIRIHSIHFHPQDGGHICRRNVGNTAHLNTIQRLKTRFNVNREPSQKPESLLLTQVHISFVQLQWVKRSASRT